MTVLKNGQIVTGIAAGLSVVLGILSPALASSAVIDGELLSQAPDTTTRGGEAILSNTSVRGQITSITGDQVQLSLTTGNTQTYNVPAFDQHLYGLRVGSTVTLTVRKSDNYVIAISDVTSN